MPTCSKPSTIWSVVHALSQLILGGGKQNITWGKYYDSPFLYTTVTKFEALWVDEPLFF